PQIMARWREGLPKLWLTARLLELRKQEQEIFAGGDYEALEVVGDEAAHVLAFARSLDDQRTILVPMPRQVLHHLDPWGASRLSGAFARTRLNLGGDAAFRSITGGSVQTADISLATLWQDAPVA